MEDMDLGNDAVLTERSHLPLRPGDGAPPTTGNGVVDDFDMDMHAAKHDGLYSSPQPAQALNRGRSPSTVSSLDDGVAVDANATLIIMEPTTTPMIDRMSSSLRMPASEPSSLSASQDEPSTQSIPLDAATTTKRRRVNPNNTSPTPSNAMSTPPSVVAKRKKIATKNRFLNLLQIDMKEPPPEKPKPRTQVVHEAKPAAKARTHTAPPRRRACATNPSPKSRRASTGAPRAKGKRKLSFAAPSSSSEDDAEVLDSSDDDKDGDDTHHDDDDASRVARPAVYPWLVRQEKGKPPPEDWMWTMFDRDYFQPIDVSRADELDRMSRAVATMGDPFIRAAPPGWLPDAHDEAPFVMPLRGRYYREVWQDQEFVEAVGGDFVALDDNHVLASGYNDDVFEDYYCKLEAAVGDDGSFPIDGLLPDPTPTPTQATETDEIVIALEQCVAAFVPQVLSNWHTLRHLADRVRDMAPFDAIYQQEEAFVQRIEASYNALRRRSKKAPGKRSLLLRAAPSRTPAQTAACAYATQFATQLVVGDDVDYLDATGQWTSAVVVDVYPEAGDRLTHVKVHVHMCSLASQLWVAVTGGRLLPPGAVSTREAPHLSVQMKAEGQRGGVYSAARATAVLPCPSATVAIARTLETLFAASKP